mgnify:CR=1 FL=1
MGSFTGGGFGVTILLSPLLPLFCGASISNCYIAGLIQLRLALIVVWAFEKVQIGVTFC